jgi:hypothetical protein
VSCVWETLGTGRDLCTGSIWILFNARPNSWSALVLFQMQIAFVFEVLFGAVQIYIEDQKGRLCHEKILICEPGRTAIFSMYVVLYHLMAL